MAVAAALLRDEAMYQDAASVGPPAAYAWICATRGFRISGPLRVPIGTRFNLPRMFATKLCTVLGAME